VDDSVFPKETTIVRLPPARMIAQEHLFFLGQSLLAYKRSRSRIFAWLERSQIRMGAYAPGGAARQRDRAADLNGAQAEVTAYVNGVPQCELRLYGDGQVQSIGLALSVEELEWLASEINDHLGKLRVQQPEES